MEFLHSRRAVLRLASGAGALLCAAPSLANPFAESDMPGDIGLQAITVMPELSRDLRGTLRSVRRMGYRSLQTIGTLGQDVRTLRDRLHAAGLHSDSQHVCPNAFYAVMEAWSAKTMSMAAVFEEIRKVYSLEQMPALIEAAIGTATILGQNTVVWSNLLAEDLVTTGAVERLADAFMAAGRVCRSAGLDFAFHNGSKGFAPVDGKRPYDILLERTDPAVVRMEIDVYWAYKVGIDPLAYIARNPGRYTLCHLKDMNTAGDIVGIGDGVIDFARVLAAGAAGGIADYYVEYDQAPHPLADAAQALQRLRTIRARHGG